MEEGKRSVIFFREGDGVRDGVLRGRRKVGGAKDATEVGPAVDARAGSEDRADGEEDDLLRDGAPEQLLDAAQAAGADDDEVGVALLRCFKQSPSHIAVIKKCFVGDAVKALAGSEQRAFHRGLHLWEGEPKIGGGAVCVARGDVVEQESAIVVPRHAYGEGKGVKATGREIDGEKDVSQLDSGQRVLIDSIHARPHKTDWSRERSGICLRFRLTGDCLPAGKYRAPARARYPHAGVWSSIMTDVGFLWPRLSVNSGFGW